MPWLDEEIRTFSTFLEEARLEHRLKVEHKGQEVQPVQARALVCLLRRAILARGRVLQPLVEFQELVEPRPLEVPILRKFVSLRLLSKKCDCRMTRSIRNETSTSRS